MTLHALAAALFIGFMLVIIFEVVWSNRQVVPTVNEEPVNINLGSVHG
jgi:hypothetical protein